MQLIDDFKFLIDSLDKRKVYKHKAHVDKMAAIYRAMVTGEGMELLLKRSKRQTDEEYKEKVEEVISIVPPIIEGLTLPFNKTFSSTSISKSITHESGTENDKNDSITKLINAANSFYGHKSVDEYLAEYLTQINSLDPNAYIAIHYDNELDIKPYPIIIWSRQIQNKEFKNNQIDKLLVSIENGHILYAANQNIKLVKEENNRVHDHAGTFESKNIDKLESLENVDLIKTMDGQVYRIEIQRHELEKIPVVNFGYKLDAITDFETFVPVWNPALVYLEKLIKRDYELELSYEHHCFPQKLMLLDPCEGSFVGKTRVTCRGGIGSDGNVCSNCGGTGHAMQIKSADETMVFSMPDRRRNEQQIDLTKIVHYVKPEVSTLTKLEESIKMHLENVNRAVYNSDAFSKSSVNGVRSEEEISRNYDNVYDTLLPFTKHTTYIWKFIYRTIAELTDTSNNIIIHRFADRDLKFKSINEYIGDLKLLNESNAPTFVKIDVSNKIAEILYRGDENALRISKVKMMHTPFSGKSEVQIAMALASEFVCDETKVLYENIDEIFDNFDHKFYFLSKEKQKEEIAKEVSKKIEALGKNKVKAINFDGLSKTA